MEQSEAPSAPALGSMAENASITLIRNGVETDIRFKLPVTGIIGRFAPDSGPIDIDLGSLEEGSYISRKHAQITKGDEGWMIKDLGSSNGTWIKGAEFEKVESHPLVEGTIFALGNVQFAFHEGGEEPPLTEDQFISIEPPPEPAPEAPNPEP